MIKIDYNKIEDSIFKSAMETFKQSAVDFFNIGTKIIAPANIEIKNIEIKTNFTDYLFYTEDDNYLHFEFQTTNKKEDIKRFLYYDASLYYRDKRKVRTIVVYSADINKVDDFIDAGTIKYSIEPFYMNKIDGDEKYYYLKDKIYNGLKLTNEDLLSLSFLPLMKGRVSKTQRTIESIELAENIKDSDNKLQCITLLYALFEKFGDEKSKNKFKEVFVMTEIGRMIREEGIKEGIKEGKSEILIKQLTKKFGNVSKENEEKIKNLSDRVIDIILVDIFELESLKDLDKYF